MTCAMKNKAWTWYLPNHLVLAKILCSSGNRYVFPSTYLHVFVRMGSARPSIFNILNVLPTPPNNASSTVNNVTFLFVLLVFPLGNTLATFLQILKAKTK